MSKDITYRKMIQSTRWRQLRRLKLAISPTCEQCATRGRVRSAQCVHHKMPVERAKSEAQAETLCFSLNNLQALCNECHNDLHNAQRYHSKVAHKQHTHDALVRWREKHKI